MSFIPPLDPPAYLDMQRIRMTEPVVPAVRRRPAKFKDVAFSHTEPPSAVRR
jgi:hypothetical protein